MSIARLVDGLDVAREALADALADVDNTIGRTPAPPEPLVDLRSRLRHTRGQLEVWAAAALAVLAEADARIHPEPVSPTPPADADRILQRRRALDRQPDADRRIDAD